jgi:DNA-binding transcriptional ArsR family regulator
VFPSIDIRVRTGLVIIPPSSGRRWITTFDETDLPELPAWFCELILADRKPPAPNNSKSGGLILSDQETPSEPEKKRIKVNSAWRLPAFGKDILKFDPAPIPKKVMYRLRISKNYGSLWHKDSPYLRDQSNSCYEYYLCRLGFSYGLSTNQVMTLIQLWWSFHKITGKIDRLVRKTIPDAWEAVKERVEEFQRRKQAEKHKKENNKTVTRIIRFLLDRESASPSELEKALELSHSAAQMALKRMSARGLIERCGRGVYRVVICDETGT